MQSVASETRREPPDIDAALDPDETLEPRQRDVVRRTALAWLANRAHAHFGKGEFVQARDTFRRVVVEEPGDWAAKARLANCCFHLGELEECRAFAAEVIDAKPDLPWGYLIGAAGLVFDAQSDDAAEFLSRALETGRKLPNTALRLGVLHLLRREWPQAEALFRDALEAMPDSVEAHDGLGCALHGQERHEEAVATFKAGLGRVYHYPLGHFHLGMALASLGRWQEAGASVCTALAQDPFLSGAEALLDRVTRAAVAQTRKA